MLNGVEVPDTYAHPSNTPFTLPANAPVRQYIPVPIQPTPDGVSRRVGYIRVGDLDGDGEYDFVFPRFHPTVTTNIYVDAYRRDGTLLWRVDLGPNSLNQYSIEPGASAIDIGHGDNMAVYDLDGDGRAEVILRTARGVVLPNGTVIPGPDDNTQYISILDGLTGRERARDTVPNPYLADGPLNGHMGILYDGKRPVLIYKAKNRRDDGTFQGITSAWTYRNGTLTRLWTWLHSSAWAPEAHQIRLGDLDHDGRDEFQDIGYALRVDGTYMWGNPEIGHGDRFHTLDIDPDRPGLETFLIQQDNPSGLGMALIEAATGKFIKKWYLGGVGDVGRGVAADFDLNHRGCEMFSTMANLYDCKGNVIYNTHPWPVETIWWDSDPARELLVTVGSTGESPAIGKFNPSNPGTPTRIYTIYNETPPGVYWLYGGRPNFCGDILGDWREELVLPANDNSEIRIYITKIPATNRLYCLMHNGQYRIQAVTKGYWQSAYVDYYLGGDMDPPPPAPFSNARLVWRGGGSNLWDVGVTPNWLTNNLWVSNFTAVPYQQGDSVLFDISGSNHVSIHLTTDLQPAEVTVYSPRDYTFAGPGRLSGPMKLTKVGGGRLILLGTNTYSGRTLVAEGSLVVHGHLINSPLTVRGGTWLDGRLSGTGIVSAPVTIQRNGGLSPGNGTNAPGTLTIANNLTLHNSLNDFDLSDDPSGSVRKNDRVIVTGNLTLLGTNTFRIWRLNTNVSAGYYPLISYSGTFSGSLAALRTVGLEGIPHTFTNRANQLELWVRPTRAPATVVWTGGLNNNAWDLAHTPNWLNGTNQDVFMPGDTVYFDNTGASNLTVRLSDWLPAAKVVVNSTLNYTFTGDGGLMGAASVLKSNTGSLTLLAGNNTYTGRTVIAGGTLIVPTLEPSGFPSALGSASPDPSNILLTSGATLRVNSQAYTDRGLTLGPGTNTLDVTGSQLTLAGPMVGTGTLRKTGGGTLALSASNSFTGGTIIESGAINLLDSRGNIYGLGTGPVIFINGTLSYMDLQASLSYPQNFIVPAGCSGRINCDGRSSLTGSLTGAGTFTVYVGYVRTDFRGDWSGFTGQINVVTDSDGGDFRLNNRAGLPGARLNLASLASLQNRVSGTPTIPIGELAGAPGSNLSAPGGNGGLPVIWSVGGLNTSATFAGNTFNNVGLIKVGTGTWTLSGTNLAHTGPTTINAGTLLYNGIGTNSTSPLTVNTSGTLGGTGFIGGNVTVHGTLNPGPTAGSSIGTLTVSGNVTFSPSGRAVMEINKTMASHDRLVVGGTLTCGGMLVVTNLGGTLSAGDSFKLFDARVYAGAFSNFALPPLPAGLAWDTSALNTNGTLRVVAQKPAGANIAFVSFHPADDQPDATAAGAGFTNAPDAGYTRLLRARGHTVTRLVTVDSADANPDFIAALQTNDLVIISRSVPSSHYQQANETAFWNGLSKPVMILGGYIIRGGTGGGSRLGLTTGETMVDTTS
ncbi:hypothetical protein G4L39_13775, partial [Limisphaera ngatamarikiensis]|nr:hypothetical protein [Limisphaera ngatamarikiensis]